MDSRWTSHLPTGSTEKEEFESQVRAAIPVLTRLSNILTKDLESCKSEQRKVDMYTWPNWELMQADCNATQRTLDKIIKLCNIS